MAGKGLTRTDYWNRVTGSVRTGDTRHDETVTDMESFLLPYGQAAMTGLHSWGVADGFSVTATAGHAGLTVSPGIAIDASGQLIVLLAGGLAVTDPGIDPSDVANIPTVPVDTAGLALPTAGAVGPQYLTVRYLEVSVGGLLGNAPALVHAPWLRLQDVAGFSDAGVDVVLGRAELANDNVTTLSADLRRLVALPAQRIQLRRPTVGTDPALSVTQTVTTEVAARPDGGLSINALSPPDPPRTALTIDPAGNVGVGTAEPQRSLHVEGSQIHTGGSQAGLSFADRAGGSFVDDPDAGQRWVWFAQGGTARLWSGGDRLSVAANGDVGIGVDAAQVRRSVHTEGTEIHSGGPAGGFSFADRNPGSFVETPTAGQRWVWYAQGGTARLWSGSDRLSSSVVGEGGGLDVARRMRVRQGNDSSAGIWFFQSGPQRDRAFVGMSDDNHVGFWGNTGVGWGLTMDTTSGVVSVPHSQLSVTNDKPAPTSGPSGDANAVCALSTNGVGVWASGKTAVSAIGPSVFAGDVSVNGTISGSAKHCLVDSPADPENRTLAHACVESDERFNVYSGNVVLDGNGEARVTLPEWVTTFNKDFRYQLTCIGQSAPIYVAQEVCDDTFSIAGGAAGMKVSWQLTGIRNDAWAQANPLVVDQEKPENEKGYFLNPEVFGHDVTRHVQYKRYEHLVAAHPRRAEHMLRTYVAGRTSQLRPN